MFSCLTILFILSSLSILSILSIYISIYIVFDTLCIHMNIYICTTCTCIYIYIIYMIMSCLEGGVKCWLLCIQSGDGLYFAYTSHKHDDDLDGLLLGSSLDYNVKRRKRCCTTDQLWNCKCIHEIDPCYCDPWLRQVHVLSPKGPCMTKIAHVINTVIETFQSGGKIFWFQSIRGWHSLAYWHADSWHPHSTDAKKSDT